MVLLRSDFLGNLALSKQFKISFDLIGVGTINFGKFEDRNLFYES